MDFWSTTLIHMNWNLLQAPTSYKDSSFGGKNPKISRISIFVILTFATWAPRVAKDVPDDAKRNKGDKDEESKPLNNRLPTSNSAVIEDKETDCEPGEGSTKVAHEPRSVLGVIHPHVDCKDYVVKSEDPNEGDPDHLGDRLLHHLLDPDLWVLGPVEGHGGQVGSNEGIHPTTSASNVGVWVGERSTQTTRKHTS